MVLPEEINLEVRSASFCTQPLSGNIPITIWEKEPDLCCNLMQIKEKQQ